jgi:hypothetical protein
MHSRGKRALITSSIGKFGKFNINRHSTYDIFLRLTVVMIDRRNFIDPPARRHEEKNKRELGEHGKYGPERRTVKQAWGVAECYE